MADCTISRCSNERRTFRKELHKWSKEILYILGLERLAEELMEARVWNILVQPFTDLESSAPVDWCPEDTCYFCCAKKQPPYDPASGIVPYIEGYSSLSIDTDDTLPDQGNDSGSFFTSQSPSPDLPLDLSVSSKHCHVDWQSETSTNSVLKVPQIPVKPGRRKIDTSKRSYTEDELQAALRDIQSKKLGTRRAAVIYGIPRSTLRNKVYKLNNESRGGEKSPKNHQLVTQKDAPTDLYDAGNQAFGASAFSQALLNAFSDIQHLALEKSQGDSASLPAFKDPLKFPLLPDLIRRLAEERIESKSVDEGANVILKVPSFKPGPPVDVPESSSLFTLKELVLRKKEDCAGSPKEASTSSDSSSKSCTRPKRGRYRNYDRDNLSRAVRAVQKGEMSVHRAGTFYGVPHSTLEYKVKERHLLRPRKRDIFSSASDVSSSKGDEFKTNLSLKNLDFNQMAIEASNGSTADRPLLGSSPLWQTVPFLSMDFSASNNFFASQMMRKFQENAMFHEEMQKSQDVIESFIQSSLSPEKKPPLLLSDSVPGSQTSKV
ncbi:hypothetical protein JTE90_003305 [Oedothorax gibbosus]|uniref:HTH psq-type domain-containing protein n=1 Tax=Oedothorax gibbosus TaxID=931172 RepID=A0AAV6TXD3_9ARAC|nr:hypothetical protein JTE90_003305 [Oedothorax gibbosus]